MFYHPKNSDTQNLKEHPYARLCLLTRFTICAPKRLQIRVTNIEGILEQMDKRLNHIETEISGLRRDIERRLESLFKWTVGLILSMWVTIIMTLIPILLKILGII